MAGSGKTLGEIQQVEKSPSRCYLRRQDSYEWTWGSQKELQGLGKVEII